MFWKMTQAAGKIQNGISHVLVNITEANLQANFTKMGHQGLNQGKLGVNNIGKEVYEEE